MDNLSISLEMNEFCWGKKYGLFLFKWYTKCCTALAHLCKMNDPQWSWCRLPTGTFHFYSSQKSDRNGIISDRPSLINAFCSKKLLSIWNLNKSVLTSVFHLAKVLSLLSHIEASKKSTNKTKIVQVMIHLHEDKKFNQLCSIASQMYFFSV